ncbi:MAG: hypothetical protein HY909_05890 [Deltaproteobacteria bacterium]|nr:hypothetical protein [Deltaproteobacteria bacterium]
MKTHLFGIAVALYFYTPNVHSQSTAPPLGVVLESPLAGVVDGDFTVALDARVTDPAVTEALLTVNGLTYPVRVEDGSVHQTVVAFPGNNRVAVTVRRGAVTVSDSVTFFLRGASAELLVLLGWPSRGEIIDLWTREPSGETCKWDHRETASGGRLLDFSSDAIGFGSQAYVSSHVQAGRYRVKIHYWGAAAAEDGRDLTSYQDTLVLLDGVLSELSQGPSWERRGELVGRRSSLEASLDRWSLPAAPQTPVRAEVVLFPGGAAERRWRFDRTPQREGELLTLGEVDVTPAMIAAARRPAP